jgi:NAD(P)-dependent dehydrogenase (short-subunit alcohol dehydrogenase family)
MLTNNHHHPPPASTTWPSGRRSRVERAVSNAWSRPYSNRARSATTQTVAAWNAMNGQQAGDPAKLAHALVQLASQDEPRARWVAGADAIATVEHKANDLLAHADAYRELSSNLAHDDA